MALALTGFAAFDNSLILGYLLFICCEIIEYTQMYMKVCRYTLRAMINCKLIPQYYPGYMLPRPISRIQMPIYPRRHGKSQLVIPFTIDGQ